MADLAAAGEGPLRLDLDHRLVGLDLDYWLVSLHGSTDWYQPADNLGFGQSFADIRETELLCHQPSRVRRTAATIRSTDGR